MAEETLYGIHAVIAALKNGRRHVSKILVDARRHDDRGPADHDPG